MAAFNVLTLISLTIVFVTVIPLISAQCNKKGSSQSTSAKIKESILCNYDKEYRPIKDQKGYINVTVRMVLRSLSDSREELDIQDWIGLSWKDEFLKWDPSNFNSLNMLHISSNDIWTPDLKVMSEKDIDEKVIDSLDCLVYSTGTVVCVSENVHSAKCDVDMYHWPYETKSCSIEFTSGIYNSSKLRLKFYSNPIIITDLSESPEWRLENSTAEISSYTKTEETYHYLKYTFLIKRQSGLVTATVFTPTLSLITMTLLPLWLKPGNAERLSLVAANILSHFLFIQHMGWISPYTSARLPKTVTFFRDSLCLAVVALIELTLVNSLLSNRTASPSWLLTPCKFVANGVFGRGLLLEEVQHQEVKDEENVSPVEDDKQIKTKQRHEEKILIATVADRICFIVMLLLYFILVVCAFFV